MSGDLKPRDEKLPDAAPAEVVPPTKPEAAEIVRHEIHWAQHWSGPVPSPADLVQFQKVDPTFPDRLIVMAEKEQAQRHRRENEDAESFHAFARRGQWTGGIMFTIWMILAFVLLFIGKTGPGVLALILEGAGVLALFIAGKISGKKEAAGQDQGKD